MRKFRSHKIVEAAQVVGIDREHNQVRLSDGPGQFHHLDVPASFFALGVPQMDDYLVRYEDGYLSWSPKKAFEEGYTAVPDGGGSPV